MVPRLNDLRFISPMTPALVAEAPAGTRWLHEIKYDGYRTQLIVEGSQARAYTRRGLDWSDEYGVIVDAARTLGCTSAIIDGEVAVQGDKGVTDFKALKAAIKSQPHRLIFFGFDMMHLDGEDLRKRPIEERREALRVLLTGAPPVFHFSEAVDLDGADVFRLAEQLGLEGIVSKRKGSFYSARNATAWQKTKCYTTGTFEVIGVDKTPTGVPVALLAALGDEGRVYAGNAFIGLSAKHRDPFWRFVEGNEAGEAPIVGLRKKGATWIQPGMTAEVKFLRGEGQLRHASVIGARIKGRRI